MTGIHAKIIGNTRRCSCRWLMLGRENRRGFPFRVKRLVKRKSAAGAGLGAFEARYPLNLIDSPRSPAGWARTQPFITAHLLETSQVELLYGCLENKRLFVFTGFSHFLPQIQQHSHFIWQPHHRWQPPALVHRNFIWAIKQARSTKGEPYGSHISQSNLACTVASN